MNLEPGIHPGIPEADYHADPCPAPSLSSSIARLIVQRSPRHAWAAHPKLGGEPDYDATPAMEEGTLLHSLILGTAQGVAIVNAEDWRGKPAQERRREAREIGSIPVLAQRMAEMERCAAAFREQLAAHEECAAALTAGQPEATMVWREGDIWCRARADWLRDDRRAPIYDLKSTAGSADPNTWEKKLREDYAIQAAFYLRGARALGLRPVAMIFLVIETKAPYGLCAFQPDPALLELADEHVDRAMATWSECLASGRWPGYPTRICTVEPPPWLIAREEERREREAWNKRQKKATAQQISAWNDFLLPEGLST